jgi:fibronectin-binding autotransporter adhesin
MAVLRLRWFAGLFLAAWCVLLLERPGRATPPAGTNWSLAFADEFNGTSVDSMKWSLGYPWDSSSTSPNNVSVSGGYLNLSASRVNSSTFTGAVLATENTSYNELFGMTYGYVEASIKLPSVPGSWPTLWMLESGWPPELDICEDPVFVSGTNLNEYSDNEHYTNSSGNAASLGNGVFNPGQGNLSTGFNTYGMQWTPTSVTFYCNGNVESTITDPTAIANLVKSGGGPMYLLLSMTGSGWPGTPSESQWPDGTSSTEQVDWVRVWKNSGGTPSSITWNNTATSGVGSWTNGGAWSGGAAPQMANQTAIFGANAVNGNQTVNWNYSQTAGGLTFNSSTSYTIGNVGGSLMLANSSPTAVVQATSASTVSQTINSRLELYNNTVLQNSMTGGQLLTVNGSIIDEGSQTLTTSGAGTVVLAAANTYAGGTTVSAGTLVMANPSALGTGDATLSAGGTLVIRTNGGDTAYNMHLGSSNTGTIASDILVGGTGINHTLGTLAVGSNSTLNITAGPNVAGGSPAITLGNVSMSSGVGAGPTTFNPTSANLALGAISSTTNFAKTLVLDGTSGNNIVTGGISNGTNVVSLTKSNSSTWTLMGANTYTGTTNIAGGRLVLDNTGLPDTSGVSVASGARLTAEGNTVTGGPMTASGTLDLVDGTINTLSVGGALSLNNATLSLEAGSLTADRIAASGAASIAGTNTINIAAVPGQAMANGGSYTILTAAGGLSAANFKVGAVPASLGFYSFGLATSGAGALLVSITGNSMPAVACWTGKASAALGDTANNWGSGPSINATNWSTDPAGANDPQQLPGSTTSVVFTAANAAAGSGTLSTQLDSAYSVQGLTFNVPSGPGIFSTVLNTNGYSLTVGSGGIAVAPASNSSATLSGSGAVLLSGNQAWANNSSSQTLAVAAGISPVFGATTLTFSGTGAGGITLSGVLFDGGGTLSTVFNQAGTTVISASDTYSGTTTVSGGLVQITSTGRLVSNITIGSGGTLQLDGGTDLIGDAATVAVQPGGIFDVREATAGAAKTETIGMLTGGGTVTRGNAGAATLTVGASGLSGTFSGTIQNGAGSFALVKTGGGTLALAGPSTYSGGTTINDNGGWLLVSNPAALGTGSVTIGNGNSNQSGELQASGGIAITSVPTINFESRLASNAGGSANIENVTGNNSISANLNINLTGGSCANILSTAGSLTLGGNLSSTGLSSPRGFDFYGAGNGQVNGVISNGTAQPTFVQMDGPGAWTLGANNTFTGGTTVNGGLLVFSGNNNFGGGGVTVNGGTAAFSASNTFTGLVTLNGGTVVMANPAALGNSSITLASNGLVGGTLVVQTGGGDTPYNINVGSTDTVTLVSDVKTVGTGINHTLGTLAIGRATTASFTAGGNVTGGSPAITLGNVTLSSGFGPGPTTFNPTTAAVTLGAVTTSTNSLKTLVLDGTSAGNFVAGAITDGSNEIAVVKSNSSTWTLSGASTYTAGTTVSGGVLNVTGAITASATDAITTVASGSASAVLQISGTMTQYSMALGTGSGGVGAVIQTGGSVATALAGSHTLAIGDIAGGYGYYKLAGGGLTTQVTQIASWGPAAGNNGGSGILEVNGGTLNNLGFLAMTRSATANAQTGVLNLSGGLINCNGGGLQANWGTGQTAVINVRGGTLATANPGAPGPIALNVGGAGNTGILNLDGGLVQTADIYGESAAVNFNGGTLRANNASSNFLSVGSAYVYAGGATIDTNGNAVTLAQSLLTPSGSGITAGGLAASGSGYAAPPIVSIIDPTGSGATAVANIDANGNLTGITVTNPGVGYTSPTFTLSGGGGSGSVAGTASLAANVGGGLTKVGGGTLVVQSNNSYAGPTVISGGVLQLAHIVPQLAYDFTTGSAVNTGSNASKVTSTTVGSPVFSASGGPSGLGAMSLNGSNYLAITANSLPDLSGSASYTIGMWIKTTEAGASFLYKGTVGAWSSGDEDFYLTGNTPNGVIDASGPHVGGVQWGGGFLGGNTAVNTGTWQFVSIVRSGQAATVYVNGVSDGTTYGGANFGMGNAEQGTQLIALGYNSGAAHDGALMFSGSISGTYVYNTALTAAQIQSLMNAGPAGIYGSLPSTTALSITSSGAALDLDGGQQTVASLSGAAGASVYLGGGTLTVANAAATTFAGNISDSGGAGPGVGGQLAMDGPGTLVLSGTNTYAGGTTVADGTLIAANSEAIGDGTGLCVGQNLSLFSAVVPFKGGQAAAPPAVAPVPESSTLALLAACSIAGIGIRRRRAAGSLHRCAGTGFISLRRRKRS